MSQHTLTSTKAGLVVAVLVVVLISGVGSVSAAPILNSENGHYYELVNYPYITWNVANAAASGTVLSGTSGWYGHLATVTSAAENDFISSHFGASSLSLKWIGGFQDSTNSSTRNIGWQWVTGESWDYTNWNTITSDEPNNYYYSGYGYEDALTYWDASGVAKWNDAPRLWNRYSTGGYLIEWDNIHSLIDIKPGSFPNSINAREHGTVPVAILGNADFDVTTINISSIELGGVGVDLRGSAKGPKLAYSFEDVNSDGFSDLVAHVSVPMLQLTGSETELSLTAISTNGVDIRGSDSVKIISS